MKNKSKLNRVILQEKIKDTSIGTWIFLGIMFMFIVGAITCIVVAMHLCGFTLITFLKKFYAWVILVVVFILVALLIFAFNKFRKGR